MAIELIKGRGGPNRNIDVCLACNKEEEIVAHGLCRTCYQADYRQRHEAKVKYGESKAQRQQKRERLKVTNALVQSINTTVLHLDKAEELGLLDPESEVASASAALREAQKALKPLMRYLAEQQEKIVGKTDAAIIEAIEGVVAPDQEPDFD